VVVTFQLNGRRFLGVNGGPLYKFSEAVSLVVDCDTQEEIDYYWQRLTDGGEESMCGWLKDKYGVSWQIIPEVLYQLMNDPVKAPLVFEKFSKIRKLLLEKNIFIKTVSTVYKKIIPCHIPIIKFGYTPSGQPNTGIN